MYSKKTDAEFLEAELCRRKFSTFVKRAWAEIDSTPLVWGWHMDAVCVHLQAVAEHKISRLIISVPPGHAKSMLASVLWPAWQWALRPAWQVMSASYNEALASRDAVKSRDLMRGPWYSKHFRPWFFAEAQDLKTFFSNTRRGHRVVASPSGGGTGHRAHCILLDDPMNATDAHSPLEREKVLRWRRETLASRFAEPERPQEVIIAQRLHQADLIGELLAIGGYEHLCLPAEYSPAKGGYKTPIGEEPRKEAGALLFPERFPARVIGELKATLGSVAYAAQYQQNPMPPEGGIIKKDWFSKAWTRSENPQVPLVKLPENFDAVGVFVDAAFKKTSDSDRVAIGVFGKKDRNLFMLGMRWGRMSFGETVKEILEVSKDFPKAKIHIEEAANGAAILDQLKTAHGIHAIALKPQGGKESRVSAVSPLIEEGRLILPETAWWKDDFIEEASSFPKAPHDDAIDMVAYAMATMLGKKSAEELWRALAKAP